MQTLPRTSEGKVELWAIATGQRVVRWPVDALDMLRRGGWSLTPPELEEAAPGLLEVSQDPEVPSVAPAVESAAPLTPLGVPMVVSTQAAPAIPAKPAPTRVPKAPRGG